LVVDDDIIADFCIRMNDDALQVRKKNRFWQRAADVALKKNW
jgi:hypothetical protein